MLTILKLYGNSKETASPLFGFWRQNTQQKNFLRLEITSQRHTAKLIVRHIKYAMFAKQMIFTITTMNVIYLFIVSQQSPRQ